MSISASDVKLLRQKTGAGMMDCKKALNESAGDVEKATEWLRKKGMAKASKKSERVAAEGLVGAKILGNRALAVEVNSETDFVSGNDEFISFVEAVLDSALEANVKDVDGLKEAPFNGIESLMDGGKDLIISDVLTDKIAKIGENINPRRVASLEVENGVIAKYVHNAKSDNLGSIVALVALKTDASDKEAVENVGLQLAMHIAAAKPEALTTDGVDANKLAKEREIYSEQARASGKPENIIEKMVEGRIRKFYEEIVLPEQIFVIDGGKDKVKDFLAKQAKALGANIEIQDFILFVLGEGVEKKEDNFAEEVKVVAGGS